MALVIKVKNNSYLFARHAPLLGNMVLSIVSQKIHDSWMFD